MFEDIRLEGDFLLNSGKKSEYYYNFTLLRPSKVRKYGRQLIQTFGLAEYNFPFVAVPATKGIPLAFSIACDLDVPLIIVDKYDKVYGDTSVLCSNYLTVDDVTSTYSECKRIQSVLKCDPGGVASFIFRGEKIDPELPTWFLEKKEVEK